VPRVLHLVVKVMEWAAVAGRPIRAVLSQPRSRSLDSVLPWAEQDRDSLDTTWHCSGRKSGYRN